MKIKDISIMSFANPIAVSDLQGNVIYVNNFFLGLWGYDDDNEVLGRRLKDYWQIKEQSKDITRAIVRKGSWLGKLSAKRKDGSTFDVQLCANTISDEYSKPICILASFTDANEDNQVEMQYRSLLDQLEEKTKQLEQIIYTTSHDLRSPLINIHGFTKELEESFQQLRSILNSGDVTAKVKEKLIPILSRDIPRALEHIIKSISRIDILLSGVLKISRLGRYELTIKPLDMNKLISDVVSNFKFHIKEANIGLEIEKLPPGFGDETFINRVFSNLLSNALKSLDANRAGIIKISGKQEGGQAIYCVEDNGIGIAPENQNKIFDIFYRLDPDSTAGEGLGLTIVKNILSRHGGKVWIESELDKGSKFFVSLPTQST